ncbi:hypothetical protein PIN17_0481 [Prevotella intermedia 17]|nr:hypothetical protein PIN17_0481 [Prevotella intermedia 17]
MHGKSGCFASQNLRFRNAKAQLSLFNTIIFTKSMQTQHFYSLNIKVPILEG